MNQELEPLIKEARKYKSAEEFEEALLEQQLKLLSQPLTKQEASFLNKDLRLPGYKPKFKAGQIPNPALQEYMSQRGGLREFQPESDLRRLGMTAADFYNQVVQDIN